MRFNTFFTAVLFYACIVGSIAVAAAVAAVPASEAVAPETVGLSKQAGCGSQGPFSTATASPFIVVPCTRGAAYRCQAMDASGCNPGDVSHIDTLEVWDSNLTRQIVSRAHSNSVIFVCPPERQVRCQVKLAAATDGPSYTLRVA